MKKIYTLTITDEDGKTVRKVKSDCIMAVANDLNGDHRAGIFLSSCNGRTIAEGVMALDVLRQKIVSDSPILECMDKLGLLKDDGAFVDVSKNEDDDGDASVAAIKQMVASLFGGGK